MIKKLFNSVKIKKKKSNNTHKKFENKKTTNKTLIKVSKSYNKKIFFYLRKTRSKKERNFNLSFYIFIHAINSC